MGDIKTYDYNPLKGSICETCKYLIKRTIVPFNEDDYGINRADLNIPDDEEVVYEQFMCEEIAIDLDHVVLKCNRYKPCQRGNFMNPDFFK